MVLLSSPNPIAQLHVTKVVLAAGFTPALATISTVVSLLLGYASMVTLEGFEPATLHPSGASRV